MWGASPPTTQHECSGRALIVEASAAAQAEPTVPPWPAAPHVAHRQVRSRVGPQRSTQRVAHRHVRSPDRGVPQRSTKCTPEVHMSNVVAIRASRTFIRVVLRRKTPPEHVALCANIPNRPTVETCHIPLGWGAGATASRTVNRVCA